MTRATFRPSRRALACALTFALALPSAALITATLVGSPQLLHNAACKGYKQPGGAAKGNAGNAVGNTIADSSVGCEDSSPIAGFSGAVDAVVSPAVWVVLALVPIACVYGAGTLMFGGQRGMQTIGVALGMAVFVISLKGIIA